MKRIAVFVFIAAVSLQAEDRLLTGLWENTVMSEGKTVTRTHCITSAEAATLNLPPKAMREAAEKAILKTGKGTCKLTEFKVDGNTVSQVMVCENSTYSNTTSYRGETFETTSTLKSAGVSKVTNIKGRRLGACP